MGILGTIGGGFKGLIGVITMIPSVITLVEKVFDIFHKANAEGPDKHTIAVALVREAITAAEGFSDKDIMDQEKFAAGLDEVINGTVKMLNASVWYERGKK